jgi:prepilin-type N-terminal cleavage/methylation domain-containing protein
MRNPEGFSLLELLVSLVIMVVVILAMLTLFDRSSQMTKVENSVTDVQQNVRYGSYQLVRDVRMAGAGGIPASTSDGVTIHQLGVSLNVGSSTVLNVAKYLSNNINSTNGDGQFLGTTHHIRAGTDILHVRGVVDEPVYDLGSSSLVISGATATLTIQPCTKFTDSTTPTTDACYPYGKNDMSFFPAGVSPQPVVGSLFTVSDAIGDVGIALVSDASAVTGAKGTVATLTLDLTNVYAVSLNKGGTFPGITTPTRGGILNDKIYFIDDGTAQGATCTTAKANLVPGPCHPQLVLATWVNGGANQFDNATITPIADDIEDLQVAYGMDFYNMNCTGSAPTVACSGSAGATVNSPAATQDSSLSITTASTFASIVNGATTNVDPSESATTLDSDEWIWNVGASHPVPGGGQVEPTGGTFDWTTDLSLLRAVEVSVVGKGTNPDPKFKSLGAFSWPMMDSLATFVSADNGLAYHRRQTTIRINLRNYQQQ